MTNKTEITQKNFGKKLSGWKRSATSMRQTAQDLLDFGFDAYGEHGDAGYLSRMYVAAAEIKGLNAKRMMSYIVAHANVRYNEEKGSFAKAKKGEDAKVEDRAVAWFEFDKPQAEPKPLDVNKRLESLIKAIEDADNLKVDISEARKSLQKLTEVIDNVELEILASADEEAKAA